MTNIIKIVNLMKKLVKILVNVILMNYKMDTQSFGFLIKKKYRS